MEAWPARIAASSRAVTPKPDIRAVRTRKDETGVAPRITEVQHSVCPECANGLAFR